jgi:adenine-specific DNA glycosylase
LLQAIAPTPAAAAKLSVSRIAAASRRAGRSRGMDQAAAEIKARFSSKRPPTIQTLLASDDGYGNQTEAKSRRDPRRGHRTNQ